MQQLFCMKTNTACMYAATVLYEDQYSMHIYTSAAYDLVWNMQVVPLICPYSKYNNDELLCSHSPYKHAGGLDMFLGYNTSHMTPGQHTLSLRATDDNGLVVTIQISFYGK